MKYRQMTKFTLSLSLGLALSGLVACGPEAPAPAGANLPNTTEKASTQDASQTSPASQTANGQASTTPEQIEGSGGEQVADSPSAPEKPEPVLTEVTNQASGLTLVLESERASFSAIGQVSQIKVSLTDAKGNAVPLTQTITWSSSDEKTFSVDPDGRVTTQAQEGSATIRAKIAELKLEAELLLTVVKPASSSGGSGGGGGSSSSNSSTAVEAPTLNWLSVASGDIGETILIVGTDLSTTTTVSINGAEADFEVLGDTLLSVQIPVTSNASGSVIVTTSGGSVTLAESFTINNPLII